ncbi:hypothetical protein Hamer_G014934 [Homarus americanus]|uniref:Uncharacterized protein n=1 Tax=Homarus americanus TaxID=6706 RepID=A0A8J5JHZ0_HOMAM|nr:hypothetical protein Hamer_G014934 [Homarus americanus]
MTYIMAQKYVTSIGSSTPGDDSEWVQPQIVQPSPIPATPCSQDPPSTSGFQDAGASWLFTPRAASRRQSLSWKRGYFKETTSPKSKEVSEEMWSLCPNQAPHHLNNVAL